MNTLHTNTIKPTLTKEEALYLTAYALWLIAGILSITLWDNFEIVPVIRGYLQKTAYVLLLIKFFIKKQYTIKDVAGIALIIFCCYLASHAYYDTYIIPTMIFLYSAGDVSYNKILKCTFVIQIVIMTITIIASQTGILEDIIWVQDVRVRHSLGYDYCAYPAHLLLFITLMWFCLRKKIQIFDAIIFLALNTALYKYTVSRTDYLLSILGIFGFYIWCRNYKSTRVQRLRNWLTCYGFALAAGFSILLHYFYEPAYKLMGNLNQTLSARLAMGDDAIRTYGFSLIGNSIQWFGQGSLAADPSRIYNYVDCAFLKDTLTYGVLFLILLGIGFYRTGKIIVQNRRHPLGWAIMVLLAYSMINAHLCMLNFNAFILALSMLFSDTDAKTCGSPIFANADAKGNYGSPVFADEVGKAFPRISSEWTRSALRTGIFLLIFVYLIFVEHEPALYIAKWAPMHMWHINGYLFLLTALCWEGKPTQKLRKSLLLAVTGVFLLLVCVSDFITDKYFFYCGFSLLTFGGMFCRSWYNMDNPGQLLNEFKKACKIGFLLTLIYCLAAHPVFPEICYTGICSSASMFGILMLISMTAFLSDTLKKRMEYRNGTGAAAAFYMILLTKKISIILIAGFIVIFYLLFWISCWEKSGPILRKVRLRKILLSAITGLTAVLLIHYLLHYLSLIPGMQEMYVNDQAETAEITIEALISGKVQIQNFLNQWQSQWLLWQEYLNNLNLWGHSYVLKVDKMDIWPGNSLIMNLFRYGIPAGICYAVWLLVYFIRAFYQSLKQSDFFLLGTTLICIGAGLLGAMEMPFAQIPWVVLYMNLGWLIVSSLPKRLV